jgi:ABC-type sugar transport system substrate-binding protein
VRNYRLIAVVAVVALIGSAVAATAPAKQSAPKQKHYTIGFVTHVKGNPFIQQIIDGAQAAGRDLGVTVKVAGPAGFDADAQLKLVQDLFAAGADGVATSIAGESMVRSLNRYVKQGKPIAQFNLLSRNLNAPYVGERAANSGRILARNIVKKLGGTNASGKVIIGICAPGLAVLEERAKGVKQGLAQAKKLSAKGPFDVKVAANDNYAHWESLYAANQDAKAMIGLCAPDVASLGKLNQKVGNKVAAGGYDTTAENLAAIKSGRAYVTLGQNPFVQGYLPVKMIYDALTKNVKLKKGFVESGTEVVTKAGATEPYNLGHISFAKLQQLAKSKSAAKAFYGRLFKKGGALVNWQRKVEPVANEGK